MMVNLAKSAEDEINYDLYRPAFGHLEWRS